MEKVKKDIPYFKNGCRAIRAPYFVNIEPTAKIPKTTDFGEPQRGSKLLISLFFILTNVIFM